MIFYLRIRAVDAEIGNIETREYNALETYRFISRTSIFALNLCKTNKPPEFRTQKMQSCFMANTKLYLQ